MKKRNIWAAAISRFERDMEPAALVTGLLMIVLAVACATDMIRFELWKSADSRRTWVEWVTKD